MAGSFDGLGVVRCNFEMNGHCYIMSDLQLQPEAGEGGKFKKFKGLRG